jgi:hypothetical protein
MLRKKLFLAIKANLPFLTFLLITNPGDIQAKENTSYAKNLRFHLTSPQNEVVNDTNLAADANYKSKERFNQSNLLILQINLGSTLLLNQVITGYQSGDQIFLSLKKLVKLLEFQINFSNDNRSANGWFINKNKNFNLNLATNQCQSNNQKFLFSQNDVVVFQDDIFVDINQLQKWFGMEIFFSPHNQEIIIDSKGTLPVELRLERRSRWQKLAATKESKSATEDQKTESIKMPYSLASIPFGDLRIGSRYSKSSNGKAVLKSEFSTLLSGDFLYLNHQFFSNFENNKITNAKLTSGRQDADSNLLGPLKATEFAFGDIYTPELSLVARMQSGKGAMISNYPLQYVNEFNKTSIRGYAQAGFEVELYRNDSLIDFQIVSNNGTYEFNNVELDSGLNIIKLVFYGPAGQKREEIRKFMSGNLLKKDKFYYRFATNNNNENLIKIHNPELDQSRIDNKKNGARRLFAEAGYGLTDTTSLVGNYIRIPNDFSAKESRYGGASLRSSIFGNGLKFDLVRDLDNKFNARQASIQNSFGHYNLSADFALYDKEFISEYHPESNDPLINKTSIRLDSPFKIHNLPLRMSVIGSKENYYSKSSIDSLEDEVSLFINNKIRLTENLKYSIDSRMEGEESKIINSKTFLNYTPYSKLSFRGGLFYQIKPTADLISSNISGNYNFNSSTNLSLNYSHQFALNEQNRLVNVSNPGVNNYSANINKEFKKFILSLGSNYSDDGNYGVNLNLSVSFGYDSKYNNGVISSSPIASNGAISVRAFLDNNGNQIFDKDDKPLKDVELVIKNGGRKAITNQKGVAFISNIQTNIQSKIMVNPDSLSNPFWIAKEKEFEVTTHSGTAANIDFAILPTGYISGYVSKNKKDKNNPLANAELELIDQNNHVIKTTKSAYDGFYIFEMVPFGKYQLRISPAQLNELGFFSADLYNISLNNHNQSASGIWFVINPK